jgi:PAS domain S-box-containing protein
MAIKSNTTIHRRNFILHLQEHQEYDSPVLVKEPAHKVLASEQIAELRNEYVIARQLSDIPGVRQVYAKEGSESHPVLIFEYIQGKSLSEIIQRQSLDLLQKLQIAVEVTEILACIHEQGVMHKDISSSNILVTEEGRVHIIDFGLANTVRQEEPQELIIGKPNIDVLAYISPEQTGRMNRPVDYRTDLYSLGITLYELLVNQLPFETDDPLEMIHNHLAQSPVPLSEIDADISQPLSDIVLKLLLKDADERYQLARGLKADLAECLNQLRTTGKIEAFELGRDDYNERLVFSHNFYGRQSEIKQMVSTYEWVAQGNAKLLFVAGYSGVGKTSLVHEIRRDILAKQGVFIEGKFDQLQRTFPYSAWEQAFTELVKIWLRESDTDLADRRETILEAVGDNGQILIDIVPALESIIGPQPEIPQLGGIENQNRFNYHFNRFITAIATPEQPLVVFLDDMQWIDLASLNLIQALMTMQETSCLLIIGAYRDNEVGPDHPLAASQDRMRAESDRIVMINLEDLALEDVNLLLADSLQLTITECRPLSQVLVDKTAGNPFYIRQLLYTLESDGLLRFDPGQRRWVWDKAKLQELEARGSVVDLMLENIQKLPVDTQRTLSTAACIGSRFDTSTLNIITGQSQTDILLYLSPALKGGLIIQSNGLYMFSHDRIQEAGYALIPESDLPMTHLKIGRNLQEGIAAEDLAEELFTVVGHLNAGRVLLDNEVEKIDLAALNLAAGQKAKAASAYPEAKKYIEISLDLLGPNSWRDHYDLTLSLHNENGELAALTGQFDQVSASANLIHANAIRLLDRMRIYMVQTEAETIQYNFSKALDIGLEALRDLGIDIPAQPDPEDYQLLKERLVASLARRSDESWLEMPQMSDETALAASSLLASEMSTTYIGNPSLYPIIAYEGAILTLEFGIDTWSPFFLACVAMVSLSVVDIETPADVAMDQILFAKRIQYIAREMLKNLVTARSKTKSLLMLAFVAAWTESLEKGIELSKAAYLSGRQFGDALYSSFGAVQVAKQGLVSSMNLVDYHSLLSDYADSLSRIGQVLAPRWLAINLQTAQNLREISTDPHRLNGTYLDEDEWLPTAIASNDMSGRHNHSVCKLLLAYHFDVDDQLDKHACNAEELISGGKGNITTAQFYYYFALSKLRLAGRNGTKDDPGTMNVVNRYLQLVEIWSQSAPMTFQHMYDLIMAEKARVLGDIDAAISQYEQAISSAYESGFTHDEGLANELYARFWGERGNERFASQFMREAHSLYRKWGALAKAEHLANRYPQWVLDERVIDAGSPTAGSVGLLSSEIDLSTLLKASQEIAGKIELNSLLDNLMKIAMENAGAQKGYLILEQDLKWVISTRAEVDEKDPQDEMFVPVAGSGLLSEGIFTYVARTQQTVLLEDAFQSGDFVSDPYVHGNEVRSLLCTPLINQGETSAILYLENNLSPGVFTSKRVELLHLLSSQMAISIDNARVHNRLEELLDERSKALISAEEQIRTLFENAQVGIALTTFEGKFLSVNNALLNLTGYTEEEILKRNVAELYVDTDERGQLLEKLEESTAVHNFGVRAWRKDGTFFYANLNVSKITQKGEEILLALVEDVTERVKTEELLEQSAARAERDRLARDLHDSVTQSMYSASLIAETLPVIWEDDPDQGRSGLEQLERLTQGALAEMRALLLELRPASLTDQDLPVLLRQLVEATMAKTNTNITTTIVGECAVPDNEKIALYRITQEALNNVVKHAKAQRATVSLHEDGDSIALSIMDDGRGFNTEATQSSGMGFGIMRDRAREIDAVISINSQSNQGTEIVVEWRDNTRTKSERENK